MRSKLTWWMVTGVALFCVYLLKERISTPESPGQTHASQTESTDLDPVAHETVADRAPAQTSLDDTPSSPTIIESTFYNGQTPEEIRNAQSTNESWANSYSILDTWTVQLASGIDPESVADKLGGEFVEAVRGFSDIFVIRFPGSAHETMARAVAEKLESAPNLIWFEQEVLETFALRYDQSPPPFSDPLLVDQWHLQNVGDRWNVAGEDSNIYPAWNQGVSGAGIFVAIVDTGTQGGHPDLQANYRSDLDFDYLDNDSNADPVAADETHGTAVAGVAAAANNDSCGVGAAFNAEIVGVRLIHENRGVSSSRQASAITHRADLVDVYNNSWGPDTEGGVRMSGPGTLALSAIRQSIENGRDGLGSIFVWAAGNSRSIGHDVNYDGWASHRYSIAVGSVGDHGKRSNYSQPGAAMLVCAHSNGDTSGIRTTDLAGSAGADPGDCRIDFGGTSSASPLVAGIVALMLEANPSLTWRDVQAILARTAVKVATTDADWARNGAGYWVNHNFGFGRVDAAAAVRVAREWVNLGEEILLSSDLITINQSVPDSSNAGIQAFHTENEDINVQHVAVTLDIDPVQGDTDDWGDLEVVLTSPAGTESVLALPHSDAKKSYPQWTYWTVRHLEESSKGTWTLKVYDKRSSNQHIVTSWKLDIYGSAKNEGDNQLPEAVNDEFVVTGNTILLDPLENDSDPDGDLLEVISIYRSAKSYASIHPSGKIEYTFGKDLRGRDRFGYTMSDGRGGVKTAEIRVTIPIPEAIEDQSATTRNTPVSIAVLENDGDPDGDAIRLQAFTNGAHGLVTSTEDSELLYTPEDGFVGVDQFTYTVTDDKDGSSTAEVTVWVTAGEDYALLFDGLDDKVVLSNSTSEDLNHPFTLEAWIRPTGWGEGETGYGRIMDKDSLVFYLHGTGFPDYNPNSLLISLDHANGVRSIHNTPANSVKLHQWQHVAVTYDNSSTVRMYIDGIQQTLSSPFGASSGAIKPTNQAIIVGESASGRRSFRGAIDEIRIWNGVQSQSEISLHKDERLAGDENGLIVYLPMNEGTGTTAADLRAPQQNGLITEAEWIRGIISDNSPPISSSDEIQSIVDEKLIIPVTGNDSDPDGDELRVSKILNVSEGSASVQDGSIIYQPPAGFTGLVRIDYTVDDFYNGSADSFLLIIIGEGLYYTVWEDRYFGGNLGNPEDDNDFDTLNNFNEYAFGTDPLSPEIDRSLWDFDYDLETGVTTLRFTVLQDSLDVSYKLMQSTDMVNWSIPVEGIDYQILSVREIEPDTETRVVEFPAQEGQRVFLRLEAVSLAGAE